MLKSEESTVPSEGPVDSESDLIASEGDRGHEVTGNPAPASASSALESGTASTDSFRPPPSSFLPTGWVIFGLGVAFCFVPGVVGALLTLATVVAATVLVGTDASRINVGVLRNSSLPLSGTDRMSPAGWVAGCILIWIVYVPLYLARRNRLGTAAAQTVALGLFMNDEQLAERRQRQRRQNIVTLIVLGVLIAAILAMLLWSAMS